MKKTILLIAVFICLANFINAQTLALLWAKQMGGAGNDRGFSYTIDGTFPAIKVTAQVIPPWQREGDAFEGSVTVSNENSPGASWHLEIDVLDVNGTYQSAIIYPSTTSSNQKFYSSDPQLKHESVEGNQFVYYAVPDADNNIKSQASGNTKIIHKQWTNENVVLFNNTGEELKIPLKYLNGATGAKIQIIRVPGTAHDPYLSDFPTIKIADQKITTSEYLTIPIDNTNNLKDVAPGVYQYKISYYNGPDVESSELGNFDLTKIGRYGNDHSNIETLIVFIGGNLNTIESDFQKLNNNPFDQPVADWSIVQNFNSARASSLTLRDYNTWYIAQSNTNYIENNAYDLGTGISGILTYQKNIKHIYLVCHSFGGVQIRAMLGGLGKKLDGTSDISFSDFKIGAPIEKVIFLGTPHRGVTSFSISPVDGKAAKEMKEGSQFLKTIENAYLPDGIEILNITGDDPFNTLTLREGQPSDGVVPVWSSQNPVLKKGINNYFYSPELVQLYVSYNGSERLTMGIHSGLCRTSLLNSTYSCEQASILDRILKFIHDGGSSIKSCTDIKNIAIEDNSNITQNSKINKTVTIGRQVWMAENLNVSTYRNGDPIPQVQNTKQWSELKTGAWCYYDNDPENGKKYGKLYNWYALHDPRGLAPKGFHIPSEGEWEILSDYLGMYVYAGGKLKEAGFTHWLDPNTAADNSSGFTGLPGGIRDYDGVFRYIRKSGYWWSSATWVSHFAWSHILYYNHRHLDNYYYDMVKGISVRCLRD